MEPLWRRRAGQLCKLFKTEVTQIFARKSSRSLHWVPHISGPHLIYGCFVLCVNIKHFDHLFIFARYVRE